MFWLIGLASIGCGALILIVNSLRKAPEAFEDERGFHLIRRYVESAAVLRRKKLADKKGGSGSLKEAEAHL